jgi:polyisoprenoid-binding protein YceI
MKKISIITITLLLLVSTVLAEMPDRYRILSGDVSFFSKGPLGRYEGTTSKISGEFNLDPNSLSAGIQGQIDVDVQSLDTGSKKMNKHMHNRYLHTDQFPTITFEPEQILSSSSEKLMDGEEISIVVTGNFTVHGVTNKIQSNGLALYNAETESLDVSFNFEILHSEYGIKRPSLLIKKAADEIEVEVKFSTSII